MRNCMGKIYVDIDETICFYHGEREYPNAKPSVYNISKINKLYDEGNHITYYSARKLECNRYRLVFRNQKAA